VDKRQHNEAENMLNARKENLKIAVGNFLKEGMSIEKIALGVSMGMVLGIFPVLGSTTILCAAAAIIFRLNQPLIQLVNYAVYPLQLFLLAFFYGVGNWLFNDQNSVFYGTYVVGMLQEDMWGSLAALWDMTLFAVLLWILIGPVLAVILYATLTPVIRKLSPPRSASASGTENLE
jgi:uncharacterized protein (DUF2062 family)